MLPTDRHKSFPSASSFCNQASYSSSYRLFVTVPATAHFALSLCRFTILANSPPVFIKSSGLPCSATMPSFNTMILSAASTVRIRWAITRTVLFCNSLDSAPCTFVSFSTSREAVASSRRTIGAFFRSARAIEMRWRSPPLSFAPFSPICVS